MFLLFTFLSNRPEETVGKVAWGGGFRLPWQWEDKRVGPHGASDTIMLKCEQKKCIVWLILSTSSLFQSPGTQWIFVTSKTQGDGRSRVLPVKGCGINITVVGGRNVERKHWRPSIFLLFFLFLSKGIADYIIRCKQAIGKFESLVHQIHKNAEDISSRLTLIESINLFKYPAPKSEDELPGRSGFFFLLIMGGKVSWVMIVHTHTHFIPKME